MKRHSLVVAVGISGLLMISAGVTVATDHLPEDQDIDFDPPEEPNAGLYASNDGTGLSEEGNVTAVIEASEVTPDRLDELENLGASVQSRYEQQLQVEIKAGTSSTYSNLPWVKNIRRPYRGAPSVVSEGVGVINADDLHANGTTGQNVKIGVIDVGGFNLSSPEINSNLAGNKSFKSSGGIGDGGKHGTATAEVVVDVAPDSELYVANFNYGNEYANAVDWMRNQNVDVIVMSVSFFGQPYDGDGFISDVADDAAEKDGIVWANSAGNYAQSHWQGNFSNPDGDQWLNFASGGDEANYLKGGSNLSAGDPVWITLNWDDWDQSDQDYDLHLINDSGAIVASSEGSQTGSQEPYESIRTNVPNEGKYYAAVEINSASAPQDLEMLFIDEGATPEHNVAKGSVTAPAVGDSVVSVGAFRWDGGFLESFSSRGPTNDGRTGIDVVAPDGVSNGAYGTFYGTSAAAPHVGGAAALILADEEGLSPRDVEQRLESTATDIRDPGEDIESGYGKVDVLSAVQETQDPTASFTFSPNKPTVGESVTFDASGSSDPDGSIQRYEWDYGDGNTASATGTTVSHSYSSTGTYTVELTVTDDDGITNTTTETVTVEKAGTVSINAPSNVEVDGDFDFTVEMTNSGVGEVAVESSDFGVNLSVVDADGDSVGTQTDTSVELIDISTNNSTYTLNVNVTGGTEGDTGTITAATGGNIGDSGVDDQTSVEFNVTESDPGTLSPVNGFDNPPQNLNDDGLYRDINGDGSFNLGDVIALYENYEDDSVLNNHPEVFNFNGQENPDDVTLGDVIALYEER